MTLRHDRFERELLAYLPAVYRVARQLAPAQQAEDLVQETFLRAWKYFDSFRAGENGRGWLFQILRNVYIDSRPRVVEAAASDEDLDRARLAESWQQSDARDVAARLSGALAALSPNHRLAVLLSDVEELTYAEIARIMACPIGTVMSRISRARRALAAAFHGKE